MSWPFPNAGKGGREGGRRRDEKATEERWDALALEIKSAHTRSTSEAEYDTRGGVREDGWVRSSGLAIFRGWGEEDVVVAGAFWGISEAGRSLFSSELESAPKIS